MAQAFYDAVPTPRGRGKPDGALHEVPTVRLAATALRAIRETALQALDLVGRKLPSEGGPRR